LTNTQLNQLLAKQDITEVIYRYARGADRLDRELIDSVWHDGATANYHENFYEGPACGVVDKIWQVHEGLTHHSHQMTNILIQLDGTEDPQTATSETYAAITLLANPDENNVQHVTNICVRYMDRMSKRDGRWAIDYREVVGDVLTVNGVAQSNIDRFSCRDNNDPSYQYLT